MLEWKKIAVGHGANGRGLHNTQEDSEMTEDDLDPYVVPAFLITWLRLIHDGERGAGPIEVDDKTANRAIELVNSFASSSGLAPIKTAAFDDFLKTMNITMTQGKQLGPDEIGFDGHRFPKLCVRKRYPNGQFATNEAGEPEWICFYV